MLLLFFRRTATLGAVVCLAVMANVAALNYAYGVPVKLYATMIVVSAGVLVLYDSRRLLALFVRDQTVAPAPLSSPFQDRLSAPLRWTIKVALVGSVIVSSAVAMTSTGRARSASSSGLDGAWVVTSFTRNGQSLDSSGNSARWRRFIVDAGSIVIRFESGELLRCQRTPSAQSGSIVFACAKGRRGELQWTQAGDSLQADGTFDGAPVHASARALSPSDYRLLRSRFHLISDR